MSYTDDIVRVHVENAGDLMVTRTEEREPEHFSLQTVTVTGGAAGGQYGTGGQSGIQTLLSLDPLRKAAAILPIDAPVVLCDSPQQVTSPANQAAGFPSPAGAYVPQGTSVTLEGTAAVYVVSQASTRVTVIVNRRGE